MNSTDFYKIISWFFIVPAMRLCATNKYTKLKKEYQNYDVTYTNSKQYGDITINWSGMWEVHENIADELNAFQHAYTSSFISYFLSPKIAVLLGISKELFTWKAEPDIGDRNRDLWNNVIAAKHTYDAKSSGKSFDETVEDIFLDLTSNTSVYITDCADNTKNTKYAYGSDNFISLLDIFVKSLINVILRTQYNPSLYINMRNQNSLYKKVGLEIVNINQDYSKNHRSTGGDTATSPVHSETAIQEFTNSGKNVGTLRDSNYIKNDTSENFNPNFTNYDDINKDMPTGYAADFGDSNTEKSDSEVSENTELHSEENIEEKFAVQNSVTQMPQWSSEKSENGDKINRMEYNDPDYGFPVTWEIREKKKKYPPTHLELYEIVEDIVVSLLDDFIRFMGYDKVHKL